MESGTLQMGADDPNALGSAAITVALDSATLDLNGNNLNVSWLSAGGTITDDSAGSGTSTVTLDISNSNLGPQLIGTDIADGPTRKLAFVLTGSGTMIFVGDNTYTGGTTIDSGTTLQIGYAGYTGTIEGNIVDNGLLIFAPAASMSYSGAISGSGVVYVVSSGGTGTVILTGANTFTGGTTVYYGTLQLGNGGTTGSIVGNIVDNAILQVLESGDLTLAGNISGSGSLVQAGTGTLTLSGVLTFTGGTTDPGGGAIDT